MAVVKSPIDRVIGGHKAVRDALRDTATYSSDLQGDVDVRNYRQLPLEVDPPRHHLYRTALTPFFLRSTVETLSPQFKSNADALIRNLFKAPSNDVISNLALPLVMQNLGALYAREEDVAEWISWGPDVWTAAGPIRDGFTLHSYLDRVYAEAIAGVKEDIWWRIARIEIDGKQISASEFRGIAGVMLAGGRDTLVKLFTGIMWHFGEHPDELETLRADRTKIGLAIQEFLRFFTPLPQMARTTAPESTSTVLPDDRYVGISFISGNFDESVFANPFTLDINRERNPHLSFGFGPHTCLGNHVAEIEARTFIEALLDSGLNWKIVEEKIEYHKAPYEFVPETFKTLVLHPERVAANGVTQ